MPGRGAETDTRDEAGDPGEVMPYQRTRARDDEFAYIAQRQ